MNVIKKFVIIFTLLGMALLGCSNEFVPPPSEGKGLKITISGDAINSRTLLPEEPSFSKFVIKFNHNSFFREDITLRNNEWSVTVDELEEGLWNITAEGYVSIKGIEYLAASGSREITIVPGTTQSLNIPISAQQEPGVEGFVSYSITWPEEKANYGYLEITPFNDNSLKRENIYLSGSPASENIPLAPGFYVIHLRLYNEFRTAVRSEIIHIYSGLETKIKYDLDDDDFSKYITISGTVDVRVNSIAADSVYLQAFIEKEEFEISSCWVNMENKTWSFMLPVFENDVTISIRIESVSVSGPELNPFIIVKDVFVKNQNIPNIAIGVVDITAIKLSGTINVTYNNSPIENVNIYLYYPSGISTIRLSPLDAITPWSILMLPFDTPTDITFRVSASQRFQSDYYDIYEQIFDRVVDNLTVNAFNQDISGININFGNFSSTPVSPSLLVSDTWVDGEIITSYDFDWYSINVTGGEEYYIWLNDSWNGNSTKDMPVDVYAYDIDGTPIYLSRHSYMWNEPASFTAHSSGTVYIRVRANNGFDYTGTYGIVYSTDNNRPMIGKFEGSLADRLEWIKLNTTGGDYTINVTSNETIDPQNLYYNGNVVSITLIGDVTERIIDLNGGSMFNIYSNVTLILSNNITLQGNSSNSHTLIQVNPNGNLVMDTGSKITGNTATYGGGVSVSGGIFTMKGGEISGNTAFYGGGVYIGNGTFTMNGGEISGNTASSYGGGVYVDSGTFTKTGGTITGYANDIVNGNVVKDGSGVVQNMGHAVYVGSNPEKRRENTAGPIINLNSNVAGAAGGWE